MAKLYDIAILGATPAGYAAAAHLAGAKCDVVLLDAQPQNSMSCPLCDWAGRNFFAAGAKGPLPRSMARKIKAVEFRRVVYHDKAVARQVEHVSRNPLGYFLPAGALNQTMRQAASRAGAVTRSTKTTPAIRPEEDHIELIGTRQFHAKLLIVAQDDPAGILNELGRPTRPRQLMSVVALDVPLSAPATAQYKKCRKISHAMHVVELPERSELGMFFVVGRVLHVRVISTSLAAGVRTVELSAMLQRLQKADILPADLALNKARGAVWHPPAGLAMELETHEAKRTLLAGSAGGFADSITGHDLAPSVVSGILAAQTALAALKSPNPQETLMTYTKHWHKSLADYLRPPNTSLSMLLPLLFTNKRIVGRFTNALLFGKDI